MIDSDERFARWIQRIEARHLADLTFQEVVRALRALSSTYVERRRDRGTTATHTALSGNGKRAAFALFYAPLHFLLVREIMERVGGAAGGETIVDLGCGTGAAGAAWASVAGNTRRVVGIDRHAWALDEAAATYRDFQLSARTERADISSARWPKPPVSVVAAFTLNELSDDARRKMLGRLLDRSAGAGDRGDARPRRILIVEPLAGFVAPWWRDWAVAFAGAGGRADDWRITVDLPAIVSKLDRAAGLDHRELTGRSLWLARGTERTTSDR